MLNVREGFKAVFPKVCPVEAQIWTPSAERGCCEQTKGAYEYSILEVPKVQQQTKCSKAQQS